MTPSSEAERIRRTLVERWAVLHCPADSLHPKTYLAIPESLFDAMTEAITTALTQARAAQREADAKYLEEVSKGYDHVPERRSSEPHYDALSFASGYRLACRSLAAAIRSEGRA